MGLIHSRASKKRAKEEAKLLKEQRKQLKAQGKRMMRGQVQRGDTTAREQAAGDNPWRQPTLGGAIGAWQRNRQQG